MKKKVKEIIVTVCSGAVDVYFVPKGVNVIVLDYDIESYDDNDKRLKEDAAGTKYIERIFGE